MLYPPICMRPTKQAPRVLIVWASCTHRHLIMPAIAIAAVAICLPTALAHPACHLHGCSVRPNTLDPHNKQPRCSLCGSHACHSAASCAQMLPTPLLPPASPHQARHLHGHPVLPNYGTHITSTPRAHYVGLVRAAALSLMR
jgi:hypothetical protein